MRCYKGETLVDAMVQTRGQQTGDQSPSVRGVLWGFTAKGDTVSTAVTSGNILKPAVSGPSAEHSAAVLAGRDEPVSPLGAGSPTTISVSAPTGVSVLPLGVVSQAGNGVQMTDSQRVSKGCSDINGAIGGLANTGHHALYSVPPHRNPISQPIIYGDLSSGPVTTNFGSQGGDPNLFGLPAPVYAGTVPAGTSNSAPTAAVRTRSTPAARVDKSGTETALRDQRLANYEARLKQKGSVSPVLNAVVSARAPRSIEHNQMVHPGAYSVSNPLPVGEAVSPCIRHQQHAHRLSACPEPPSVRGHYMGTRSVPRYVETSDDDNYQPGFHAQPYLGAHEHSPAHPDVTKGYQEWLSCHDQYEAPNRPAPAPFPRHGELGIPQQPIVDRTSKRPIARLELT